MITNLQLKNFKCFEDESLSLKPFTLLTGLNSSGKSTVLQALRILHQGDAKPIQGRPEELVRNRPSKGSFTISANHSTLQECDVTFKIEESGAYNFLVREGDRGDFASIVKLSFISADRLGPAESLPVYLGPSVLDGNDIVGDLGELVLGFIHRHESKIQIPAAIRHESQSEQAGLLVQINAWLSEISPDPAFSYIINPGSQSATSVFAGQSPFNVGYGLSYALSVVVAALGYAALRQTSPDKDFVLLIENPEAHLHPHGQVMLAKLLAQAVSCGVQCIVESHSDHFLNGLRLAVKGGQIKPEDTIVYYFDKEEGETEFSTVVIDKYGKCNHWPEGFFDESRKSLLELL